MSDRLDDLVARWAALPPDRSLDGLEADVRRRILARQREARTSATLAPVRVASVALALAMGITAGGAVAASAMVAPKHYGTFSSAGRLAPSTLLEGQH